MKKLISFASILTACVFLTACAPAMNGLYHDKSFTYKAMHAQSMAVAGVTEVQGQRHGKRWRNRHQASVSEQNAYAQMFREAMLNQRPHLTIMPAGDVAQTMGHQYRDMMTYYADHGVAANQYLNLLAKRTHNVRYVVFGRILSDTVGHQRYTNANPPLYSKPKRPCKWRHKPCDWKRYICYEDDKGVCRRKAHPTVKYNPDAVDYVTTRSINIGVKIYDLTNKRIVWSGSLNQSANNANHYGMYYGTRYKHDHGANKGARDQNRELNHISKHATFPGAPAKLNLISQIMNGIAMNLPEQNKSWI